MHCSFPLVVFFKHRWKYKERYVRWLLPLVSIETGWGLRNIALRWLYDYLNTAEDQETMKTWHFHGSDYEDYYLQGLDAV
jgi:hypothetical protein